MYTGYLPPPDAHACNLEIGHQVCMAEQREMLSKVPHIDFNECKTEFLKKLDKKYNIRLFAPVIL